eukprot:7050396-Prymnesium_polylepis.1
MYAVEGIAFGVRDADPRLPPRSLARHSPLKRPAYFWALSRAHRGTRANHDAALVRRRALTCEHGVCGAERYAFETHLARSVTVITGRPNRVGACTD